LPGLIRGIARTAAVAGTATAVSNRVSRRQASRWAAQEGYSDAPPQQQYAPPPEPQYAAPPPEEDRVAKLRELAALKNDGILTEEEFEAEKRRLLAG
jgi:hypothetical protein